jgi:hypothetical protein
MQAPASVTMFGRCKWNIVIKREPPQLFQPRRLSSPITLCYFLAPRVPKIITGYFISFARNGPPKSGANTQKLNNPATRGTKPTIARIVPPVPPTPKRPIKMSAMPATIRMIRPVHDDINRANPIAFLSLLTFLNFVKFIFFLRYLLDAGGLEKLHRFRI